MIQLSKSDYTTYLKHPAWLWIKKHAKTILPPIDPATQAIFDTGHEFEQYAETLFPGGITLGFNDYDEYLSLPERTTQALDEGMHTIFQGRFEHEQLTFICDVIQVVEGKEVDLIEIKSSTSAKPEHIVDLAFQMVVLEKCGYTVREISVIHVNNQYVRSGAIDPKSITAKTDVTESVKAARDFTLQKIDEALQVMALTECPDVSPLNADSKSFGEWLDIYKHMKSPKPGSIYDLCQMDAKTLQNLPDNNLYLANSGTEVYRFNGTSGAFIDTFFTNSGGLTWSIAFSPNSGDMYVVSIIGGDNIVKVTQAGVATVITGTPGAKSVHILPTAPCSYSLGNRVWIDYTLPGAPTNNDGVMNSTEQPRQSVSVTLLDGSGIPVDNPNIIGTQDYVLSTDSQGYYRFDGLDTGTYKVRINSSNFGASASLEGYLSSSGASATFLTADNATDHGIDTYTPEIDGVVSNSVTLTSSNTLSDKDVGAVGAGDNATLGDVTDNLTVDFGFIPASRLGDYFWIDANKNGLQDSGELPVQNVAVTLLDSFGVAVSGYSQQNTDALGAYHFLVYPGTYKIRFTNLPNSYVLTTQNSSSSETNTSKADSDGVTIGVSVSLGDSYLNLDGGIVLGDTTVVSTPNPTVLQSTGENVLLQFMVGLGIITSVIASNVNIQSKKLIEN